MVNGCFVAALMIVPAGSSFSIQRRVVCAWGAGCVAPEVSDGVVRDRHRVRVVRPGVHHEPVVERDDRAVPRKPISISCT